MEQLTKEMKIGDLYPLQKVLDAKIIAAKSLEGQELLGNLVLGLQVKIGEMADAWRGYKHWSNKQEPFEVQTSCMGDVAERLWCGTCHIDFPPDGKYEKHEDLIGRLHSICPECNNNILMGFRTKNTVLEKYAECLSFFLAIANQLNLEEDSLYSWQEELEGDTTRVFIEMQYHASMILLEEKPEEKLLNFRVAYYIFANMLDQRFGLEWEHVVAAYLERNAINLKKQEHSLEEEKDDGK